MWLASPGAGEALLNDPSMRLVLLEVAYWLLAGSKGICGIAGQLEATSLDLTLNGVLSRE